MINNKVNKSIIYNNEDFKNQRNYWENIFSSDITEYTSSFYNERYIKTECQKEYLNFNISENLSQRLWRISNNSYENLFAICISMVTTLVYKTFNNEKILLTTPIRKEDVQDNLINYLVPIPSIVSVQCSFKELLIDIKKRYKEAYENVNFPIDMVVENLYGEDFIEKSNPFNILLALNNLHDLNTIDNINPNIKIIFNKEDSNMSFKIEYDSSLYEKIEIEYIGQHLINLANTCLNNGSIFLKDINILCDNEKEILLGNFNNTNVNYPKDKLIHELFEEQVEKNFTKTAVVMNDKKLSYAELDEKSNILAHILRDKGIRNNVIVGILLNKSPEMIISILGVLKAGGTYLPIDPTTPKERIEFILDDSNSNILLSSTKFMVDINFNNEKIDVFRDIDFKNKKCKLDNINNSSDLAYIIYTSGTTGQPKGVMVEHRNVINLISWFKKQYNLTEKTRILQSTNCAFDVSVEEIFGTLLSGCSLYIIEQEKFMDKDLFKKFMDKNEVNIAQFVPSTLQSLILDNEKIQSLNTIICGGEKLHDNLKNKILDKGYELFNHYGPTEITVDAIVTQCYKDKDLGIGKPIQNTKVYILNKNNDLLPLGAIGELCISGEGVTRGYLNRPELTCEKFINNPFEEDTKIYKTGDLARWLPNGNIEFLGRKDNQIKINGLRIELDEIENHILSNKYIKEAAVVVKKNIQDKDHICTYIVSDKDLQDLKLREYLKDRIPAYMIPTYIKKVYEMPVTTNGKPNKKYLSMLQDLNVEYDTVEEPRNNIETILVEIFKEVLGSKNIGINHNFFDLGGDSIKAIRISSKLKIHGYNMDISELFQHPTIKELSNKINIITSQSINQDLVVGEVKLSPIQKWFFNEGFNEEHHYNQAVTLFNKDRFNERVLKETFNKILDHHDALRMIYNKGNNIIIQFNNDISNELYSFESFNLKDVENYEVEIEKKSTDIQSNIDLRKGPLVKLGLFKTNIGDYLLIAIHHLIIDGISWRILFEDFNLIYNSIMKKEDITLPQKTNSFKEWTESIYEFAHSKRILKEEKYWKSIENVHIDTLPKDKIVNPSTDKLTDNVNLSLSEEETKNLLTKVNKAYNTEINDILLTALSLSISRWSKNEYICVNLEGHGRENIGSDMDVTRTIGWFTSQYPVLLPTKLEKDLGYNLKNVKESLRKIPNKGISYGILKYIKGSLQKDFPYEITFNYLGQFDQDINFDIFEMANVSSGLSISKKNYEKTSLDINCIIGFNKLNIDFAYDANKYNKETMFRLIGDYKDTLVNLINYCLEKEEIEKTPSDLGDKNLTIDQLELIKSQYKDLNIESIYELSPMQNGMLFHALKDKSSSSYFEQSLYNMKGEINIELFNKSFNKILERYEILRTNFIYKGVDKPKQIVFKHRDAKINYMDISNLDSNDIEEKFNNIVEDDLINKFDLEKDILIKISLVKIGEKEYKVIWSIHHILVDGWCTNIIINEFFKIYLSLKNAEIIELPKVTPYKNYIEWLNTKKICQYEEEEYWKEYLDDFEQSNNLQVANPNYTDKAAYKLGELIFSVDALIKEKLENIAAKEKVTMNIVLQAIWGILLQRHNNSEDVIFGTVVSGRNAEIDGIETMLGLFINTIPVRVKVSMEDTFRELIIKMQENALKSLKYDYYPLYEIMTSAKLNTSAVNNIFVCENYYSNENESVIKNELSKELSIENIYNREETNYNLNLKAFSDKEIYMKFSYNKNVYPDYYIEGLKEQILTAITSIIAADNIKIKDIEILSEKEKYKILNEFNNTYVDYTREKTIQELFEEQVKKTPDNIAVVFEDKSITYRDCNILANKLAKTLRNKGVKQDTIVGVMVNRSVEMIIGLLGVLKAGGAYLPIDSKYPKSRIEYMLENSNTEILLSHENLIKNIEFKGEIIDIFSSEVYSSEEENIENINNSSDLAYIIYTSGSTGRPKGVMVGHRQVINYINGIVRETNINNCKSILNCTTVCFDIFVTEFLVPLTCGLKVVLSNEKEQIDSEKLSNLIRNNEIEVLQMTPSRINVLLENHDFLESIKKLKVILIGGEEVRKNLVNKLHSITKPKVYNVYGPTETTVWSSIKLLHSNEKVTIGHPIQNTSIYILNSSRQLVPIGLSGEIYIGGEGVTRGYLNNKELTEERFIENPFVKGDRLYKTGDLGKWTNDGEIEFLGRIDNQVKIRGYRIELSEIENKLLQHEYVKEAAVAIKENGENNSYLCAYIVSNRDIGELNLKRYLKEILPGYMVPSYFMQLDKMIMTPNGKIDRKSLPEPEKKQLLNKDEMPRNAVEEKLVLIWKDILNLNEVSINDNFFEIGGHSLKAMELVSQIYKSFEKIISIDDIFKFPIIKELGELIDNTNISIYESIRNIDNKEYYEVSPAQKRIYILQQLEKHSKSYNMPGIYKLKGNVDKNKLQGVFTSLIERHEALRTSFKNVDGEIAQVIKEKVDFNIDYIDISNEINKENILRNTIDNFIKDFDLSIAPLLRVGLLKICENNYILMIDMHHIISDGTSMSILVKEFTKLYNEEKLENLRIQYKDFAAWQNKYLKSKEIQEQEKYWLDNFSGEIPVLDMPYDYERPQMQSFEGESIDFKLDEEVTTDLKKLCAETGSTLYMVLLSVYNIALSKYSGQEDIIVGSPIAGRPHADLQNIMGMFVNTLAMRNYPKGNKTYLEFLKEVKENSLKAYENQDYQFEELVEKLQVRRDMSRNPIFDVMFVLQNMETNNMLIKDLEIYSYNNESNISKFDLTLTASEIKDNILLNLEYCTKLFNKDTIKRFTVHFKNIIKEILKNKNIKVKNIDMLSEREKAQLITEFNNTYAEYPKKKTVQEIFEEQVEKTPENIAVVFEDKSLTYRELNNKSNSLARLLRSKGLKSDSIVGIMVERSLEMIIGIMGVLKAGGAYLPIDPTYPNERIKYMLQDSKSKILLTSFNLIDKVNENIEKIDLYDKNIYTKFDSYNDLEKINTFNDLAYIIYTSGTTGKPKGVMIEHKQIINYITYVKDNYLHDKINGMPLFTSISFDLTITSILGPLSNGEIVNIYKEDELNIVLDKIFKEETNSVIKLTPSHLKLIKESKLFNENIKRFIVGGEELTEKVARDIGEIFNNDIEIINEYGPTEATVGCIVYKYIFNEKMLIGKPINNCKIYILDQCKNMIPIGVRGELYISGEVLARGYLNKVDLTKERFIDNPYDPGKKMYKTGDVARWLSDGNIEFQGRIDNQVKIRGFRIELGEIENKLLQNPSIQAVTVAVKEVTDNNNHICAYIVSEEDLAQLDLKNYLKKSLPDYMVPSFFIKLDKIPLTINGKVNKKYLPKPNIEDLLNEYEAPRNKVEEKLIEIWNKLLDMNSIGINDNFFDLGGHSLKATFLASQIKKEFNIYIPMKEIFKSPTIKLLGEYISNNEESLLFKEIEQVGTKEFYETTSTQKRIYSLQYINPESVSYNMPEIYTIYGDLDINRVENVFSNLISRHEVFKTHFDEINGKIVQKIKDSIGLPLQYINKEYNENLEEEIKIIIDDFIQPFDLNKAPLLRICIIKKNSNEHILMYDMHHIISDGISHSILLREFVTLYNGKELSPLKIQFRDYAYWKNKIYNSEEIIIKENYWLNNLKGKLPVLNIPYDYERPLIQSFEGDILSFYLDEHITKELKDLCKKTGATMFMVLLSCYNILLSKYTNQYDILIGTPVSGRTHSDLNDTIGVFINTLVLRNYPELKKTFLQFLMEVKENSLNAFENQDYQFDDLLEKLKIKRDMSRNPIFDTMFMWGNIDSDTEIFINNIKISSYNIENKVSKFDLTLSASEINNKICLEIEYCTKLFKESTIKRFSESYVDIVTAVIYNSQIKLEEIKLKTSYVEKTNENHEVEEFNFC